MLSRVYPCYFSSGNNTEECPDSLCVASKQSVPKYNFTETLSSLCLEQGWKGPDLLMVLKWLFPTLTCRLGLPEKFLLERSRCLASQVWDDPSVEDRKKSKVLHSNKSPKWLCFMWQHLQWSFLNIVLQLYSVFSKLIPHLNSKPMRIYSKLPLNICSYTVHKWNIEALLIFNASPSTVFLVCCWTSLHLSNSALLTAHSLGENSSPHTLVFPLIIPMRIPRILYTALTVHSGSTHVERNEQFNICYY